MMLGVIAIGLAVAAAAPAVHRIAGRRAGALLALFPAAVAAYFLGFLKTVSSGGAVFSGRDWIPGLDIALRLHLDGLSLLMAILISGVGALVLIYSGAYLAGHPHLGRFYAFLLFFMTAMLGTVLCDNLLAVFVFWELTSISSFFLIGFHHEREPARKAALQALLVTGTGGLALLAGLVLLGQAAGTWDLSALAGRSEAIARHPACPAITILILLGAFTKSAHFPFHFWLPNAMEAPAPASAYLHAVTMVKAGVYLVARLGPAMAEAALWREALVAVGAATMLWGAVLALREAHLKKILAYTTVSVLGTLSLLAGLGAPAAGAFAAFLLSHAFYKGALFLVAGSIEHETGEKDVRKLSGLFRHMPRTAFAGILAALSMASLPPFLGFVAKEQMYEAVLGAPAWASWTLPAAVLASVCLFACAARVGISPFLGIPVPTPRPAHEAPPAMWAAPALLALLGLAAGLAPGALDALVVGPAATALGGRPTGTLALWHGFTLPLALSALTAAAGLLAWRLMRGRPRQGDGGRPPFPWGPAAAYEAGWLGLLRLARLQTAFLQNGYMRRYLLVVLTAGGGLVAYGWLRHADGGMPTFAAQEARPWEVAVAVLVAVAALAACRASSRLGAMAALGVVGYGGALLFVLFGAPDLAMTQIAVETLTLVLLLLVFYRLPMFATVSSRGSRARDVVVAAAMGLLMGGLVLAVQGNRLAPPISAFHAAESVPQAHGRNVVNTILVDFRALDTLGEITVLAVAAIGVAALLARDGRRGARP